MKRFCLLLFLLNSLTTIAQNDSEMIGALSEIGCYTMDANLNETTIKKELKAIFPDIVFINDAPKVIDRTMVYLEMVKNVAKDYPSHNIEYLEYFAEGFTKTQKEQLIASKNAFILVLYYQDKDVFTHTKKLFDWVYKKIKNTDYIAYDGEVRKYFLPEIWKRDRVDAWENGIPNAMPQITLHSYRKFEYCRSITLGMQRFGLPDLVIDDSPCTNTTNASQLLTIISQILLEGNQLKENDFTIDLDAIKSPSFKEVIPTILYDNATRKAMINFKKLTTLEEGDPSNTIFQVNFKNDNYKNQQAYEDEIYTNLFGVEDEVTHVNHNDKILAASERAKKKLPALQTLFNKGLDQEILLLKAPFTTDNGGNEWMWIEVTKWKDENIEGILQNDPYYIKNLKSGTKVVVQQADIFDYILQKADGTSEGNEIGKLIMKYGN